MTIESCGESLEALREEVERDCRSGRVDGNTEGLPTHFELAR